MPEPDSSARGRPSPPTVPRPDRGPASRPGRLGVGVVGAGRVGAVLGAALRAAGHAVVGVSAVSQASRERADALLPGVPVLDVPDVVERAELVLLAVPDDALAPLVAGLAATGAWQGGQLVVHTSGAHGTGVLAPARAQGAIGLAVHPVMTFSGTTLDLARLREAVFGVSADPVVLPVAQALVVEMGAEPVVIGEDARGLYHAALSHGANHLVTLVSQAAELLAAAGVERTDRALGPLLHAALDRALASGDEALTGPIARGDAGTVATHRAVIDAAGRRGAVPDDVEGTYLALAAATVLRAERAGRLRPEQALDVRRALAPRGPRTAGPEEHA